MGRQSRALPAISAAALILLVGLLALARGSSAATLPGFQETTVFSGLNHPTVIQFATDGRIFVAEKSGVIKVFDNLSDTTPTVFADLSSEVDDYWDRGLLGMALDPNFPSSPSVYVLYAYDHQLGSASGPPKWGDACPTPPGPTDDGCVISGRLSRLTDTGAYPLASSSEQPLIEDWCQQFPSHSVGSLAFGPDGNLYASGGDGASFNNTDWGQYGNKYAGDQANPCGDPPGAVGTALTAPTAEGGALRSQSVRRATGEPVSLDGAILRVDPTTGAGLPDNPFAASPNTNAKRIVAFGLRNPFRMTVRPGTNELWIGDVGWNTWEEINQVADVLGTAENFGWPCYEGNGRQSGYDGANLNLCESLYAPGDPNVVPPYFTYQHGVKVSTESCSTSSGSSVSGLAFASTAVYPPSYDGALFFSDYSRKCIWVMFKGANGLPDPATITPFVDPAAGPVYLVTGPDGKLYYADYDTGTIRRIDYISTNHSPTAVATASPTSGPAPLAVQFTGSGSTDPDGDPLSYSWDLNGDGVFGDSTAANPSYTYQQPGTYQARLRVDDGRGGQSTSSPITISASNTPPTPVIDSPSSTLTYAVGDTITFSGHANDRQDGTEPASRLSWVIAVEHCPGGTCHEHIIQTLNGVSGGSFSAPDHDYPSYLELRLTATDSLGASATTKVDINPKTVVLTFQSSPSGLQLAVGSGTGTAPFTRTVIQGSRNTIAAITPQTLAGGNYVFDRWSDGGSQTHDVIANTAATYTASYHCDDCADLSLTKTVTASSSTRTWTLRVANAGPATAQNVVVNDVLPSRLVFQSADTGCTFANGTVTCTAASLASGSSTSFSFVTTISGKSGGWIVNSAQVSSSTPDSNTTNNSASARTRK